MSTKGGGKKITREIKNYLEMNKNKNTIKQNLFYVEKVVLRGNFIAVNAYIFF